MVTQYRYLDNNSNQHLNVTKYIFHVLVLEYFNFLLLIFPLHYIYWIPLVTSYFAISDY